MLKSLQTNVISQGMIQNGTYKGKQFVFVDAFTIAKKRQARLHS